MKRQLFVLAAIFAAALLIGLTAALLSALGASSRLGNPEHAASADASPAVSVAFEGAIHVVGVGLPALWVVGDYQITVTPDTVIINNGLQPAPGVWARVEAVKTSGLQATTIQLQPAPTSDFYNRIEAISGDQWQVGGTWVTLGPATVVTGASPEVGNLALVHGSRSPGGVSADTILVVAADAEVVYQGIVNAMASDIWQVDDVTVEIAATTVISGPMPVTGSRVQARGSEVGPRRLRATHIWTLGDADLPEEFTGWLLRIDGQTFPYVWRVNLIDGPSLRPVYMAVYGDTLIDETAGPAAIGAWLVGQAVYQGDSVYRAYQIAVLPRAPKRQIVGQIVSLPAGGTVGIWRVGDYSVQVAHDTSIAGNPHVGAMVWVSGTPDYANVLQAQLIEVLGE